MPRQPRTFVGSFYFRTWVFRAATKVEAGRWFFDLLPVEWQSQTSPKALARYVGPLCWCPKRKYLWFKTAVATRPRMLHPERVPDELWAGIHEEEAGAALETLDGPASGKGPARVSATAFRKRSAGAETVAGESRRPAVTDRPRGGRPRKQPVLRGKADAGSSTI